MYSEGGNPGDSILVNHSFFNKNGLCVKEITPDYITYYEYNTDNLKVKAISERSGKTGQSVVVYNYDSKGNMILSERVQEGYEDPLNYIYHKHRLTYNVENKVINDEWIDKSGKVQTHQTQEYLGALPDSGIVEIIKYYDMYDHADRIKKEFNDGRIVIYNIGDDRNLTSYEMFFDNQQRLVKAINHYHKGPHAYDMVKEFGHGIIETSKVNELYSYNNYGLIAEKTIYKDNIMIERQTWNYVR